MVIATTSDSTTGSVINSTCEHTSSADPPDVLLPLYRFFELGVVVFFCLVVPTVLYCCCAPATSAKEKAKDQPVKLNFFEVLQLGASGLSLLGLSVITLQCNRLYLVGSLRREQGSLLQSLSDFAASVPAVALLLCLIIQYRELKRYRERVCTETYLLTVPSFFSTQRNGRSDLYCGEMVPDVCQRPLPALLPAAAGGGRLRAAHRRRDALLVELLPPRGDALLRRVGGGRPVAGLAGAVQRRRSGGGAGDGRAGEVRRGGGGDGGVGEQWWPTAAAAAAQGQSAEAAGGEQQDQGAAGVQVQRPAQNHSLPPAGGGGGGGEGQHAQRVTTDQVHRAEAVQREASKVSSSCSSTSSAC